jgi:2,3-diketo-5-methylthio-1-phosphopentane phosphatase
LKQLGNRVALLVDFDGTAAEGDVGVTVLERFARDDSWKVIDNDYVAGRVGSRMAYRIVEGIIEGSPQEWTRFVLGEFRLDAGLTSLTRLAVQEGWFLEILSDGLGYYIRALLDQAGVTLPQRTNEVVVEEAGDNAAAKIRIVTPHLNPRCGRCGTCKSERVETLAGEGWTVVYVGDGYSDLCAAPRAHRLFAKDILANHCAERKIPFESFETLEDVARALQLDNFGN